MCSQNTSVPVQFTTGEFLAFTEAPRTHFQLSFSTLRMIRQRKEGPKTAPGKKEAMDGTGLSVYFLPDGQKAEKGFEWKIPRQTEHR